MVSRIYHHIFAVLAFLNSDGEEFQLVIRVTDDGVGGSGDDTLFSEETISIKILDVNECPQLPVTHTFEVEENTEVPYEIPDSIDAEDPDVKNPAFQMLAWEIIACVNNDDQDEVIACPFSVSNGNFIVNNVLNFEDGIHTYRLTVQVTDQGGLTSDPRDAYIQIVDLPEYPEVQEGQVFILNEDQTSPGTTVGVVIATDEDEDLASMSIISGAFGADGITQDFVMMVRTMLCFSVYHS